MFNYREIYDAVFDGSLLYAHTSPYESLYDHSLKTVENYKELKNNLIRKLCDELVIPYNHVEYLSELGVFVHDFGKGTPYFQRFKMKNQDVEVEYVSDNFTKHSALSSIIFYKLGLDYINNLYSLEEIDDNEYNKILKLISVIGISIQGHHTSMKDFDSHCSKLTEVITYFNQNSYQLLDYISIPKKILFETTEVFLRFSKSKLEESENTSYYLFGQTYYALLCKSDILATKKYYNPELDISDNRYNDDSLSEFTRNYNQTDLANFVKTYKQNNSFNQNIQEITNINDLRNNLALEMNNSLNKIDNSENIFYLESGVGSGKTHLANRFVLSLLHKDKSLSKVFYALPYTSISDQVFEYASTLDKVTRLDSKSNVEYVYKENGEKDYAKTVLNRQMLDSKYSIITFVRLFDILFSHTKSNALRRLSLQNSIIVLDELQTINVNQLNVFMTVLDKYSEIYNFKLLFMSATMPRISNIVNKTGFDLVDKRYKKHPLLSQRNFISTEHKGDRKERTSGYFSILANNLLEQKRVILQCITKKKAKLIYNEIKNNAHWNVRLYTGDTPSSERKEIIRELQETDNNGYTCKQMVLVTTNCIEAGVDIDMNMAIVDYSFLDSLEQLSGRINRNNLFDKEDCPIYLINDESSVFMSPEKYSQSIRLSNNEINYRFVQKDYDDYFRRLVNGSDYSTQHKTQKENLGLLNFQKLSTDMKLINHDSLSVYVIIKRESMELIEKYEELSELMYTDRSNYDKHYLERTDVLKELQEYRHTISGAKQREFLTRFYSGEEMICIYSEDELVHLGLEI